MDEIVAQVKRVTAIMSEIAAASKEQSNGIEQVNRAVTQIDQITQQNAALVEEATAAAKSMEEQADGLVQTISVFKLPREGGKPATVAAATQEEWQRSIIQWRLERRLFWGTRSPERSNDLKAQSGMCVHGGALMGKTLPRQCGAHTKPGTDPKPPPLSS